MKETEGFESLYKKNNKKNRTYGTTVSDFFFVD
jgi:hypothetical protein